MRSKMPAVIAVCVFGLAASRSATVRGTQVQPPTAATPGSLTIRRGDAAEAGVRLDIDKFAGPESAACSRPIDIGAQDKQ